jgi:hypothetical protein
MGKPIVVACELCGLQATVEMNAHQGADGTVIEWPKATVRDGGMYFRISCPKCGSREQLMASSSDTA